jgi:hypothetical protein
MRSFFRHEFETCPLPRWLAATRRVFAFYACHDVAARRRRVADPVSSIHGYD